MIRIISPLKVAEVITATGGATFATGMVTSEQIVTIGGVAVLIIGAISAATVAIINALGKKMLDQLSAIAAKTDVIEGHVNSAATRDAAVINSQQIQLGMLRETVDRLERAALLLAQSAASVAVPIIVEKKDQPR